MKQQNGIEIKIVRLEEQLKGARETLSLQAREYERRLDILNHEAEQLKTMQINYVPRETHDNFRREIEEKMNGFGRLVYIGVGICLATEIVLQFLVNFKFK